MWLCWHVFNVIYYPLYNNLDTAWLLGVGALLDLTTTVLLALRLFLDALYYRWCCNKCRVVSLYDYDYQYKFLVVELLDQGIC